MIGVVADSDGIIVSYKWEVYSDNYEQYIPLSTKESFRYIPNSYGE